MGGGGGVKPQLCQVVLEITLTVCQIVFDNLSRSKVKIVGRGEGIVMGYPV